MKITALDIHQKEFSHGMRGYREDEVDDFLDAIAAEVDHLTKQNEELHARFREAESKIAAFNSERNAINNALLIAQRSADEITLEAENEREKVVRDAEKRASEIIHEALSQKRELLAELKRLKADEERFRKNFMRLLEDSKASISEVRLSDAVMAALTEREDSYAAAVAKAEAEKKAEAAKSAQPQPVAEPAPEVIEVAAVEIEDVQATAEFPAQSAAPEPVAAPTPAPAPKPAPQPVAQPEPAPAPKPVIPSSAPQSRAEGLIIGEVGADVPVDTTLIEPREFEIPGGDRWGDRDDELDIEEID